MRYYNEERPHYGIGFLTPVEKLMERLLNLGQEVLPKEIKWIKNQFLMKAPVKVFERYGRRIGRINAKSLYIRNTKPPPLENNIGPKGPSFRLV